MGSFLSAAARQTLDAIGKAAGFVKDVACSAPVLGALNQGRMEAAQYLGKAFPETPQFDDPAAVFNRTPLEGYQLKHGLEPGKGQSAEMTGREAPAREQAAEKTDVTPAKEVGKEAGMEMDR